MEETNVYSVFQNHAGETVLGAGNIIPHILFIYFFPHFYEELKGVWVLLTAYMRISLPKSIVS